MSELTADAIAYVAQLARAGGPSPIKIDNSNVPAVLVPDGYKVESLEKFVYNEHSAAPERIKAYPNVLDVESFVEYFNTFNDNGAVFADEKNSKVIAVLDYHQGASSPRWGQHRLTLELRKSEEWNTWFARNNKPFTQTEFAEFLEQNGMDITKPEPASIREVASDLQVHSEVSFGSGVRTSDGRLQFRYTEENKATVGGNAVIVPESFEITLPVFVGAPKITIMALLRYRVKDAKLSIFYTLIRPDHMVREAFRETRDVIASTLNITIINGAPSA